MSGVTVPTSNDALAELGTSDVEASYKLDLATSTLWRGSVPLPLRAKTLEVLRLLVSRSGQVVSSGDLRDLVWGRKHGNEHGPKQCIRELRVLFEDATERPRFIETVGRMGYRFIGPITLAKPLGGTSIQEATHDSGDLLCVGRDYELAQLAEGLTKARKGARVVHLLCGEAGAGKTRLTDRFLAGLADQDSLWVERGQCAPHPGSREPYGPLLQVLAQLIESGAAPGIRPLLRDVAPSWLVQLPGLFEASEIIEKQVELAGSAPERMVREITGVLERLTLRMPGIIVLEDLHWADAHTLAWLSAWGLRRAPSRLMIIGTYRSDEIDASEDSLTTTLRELPRSAGFYGMELAGLSLEAVRKLLDARLPGHNLPASLASDLVERTEGHALFITEVIEDWLARGLVTRVGGRWALQANVSELLDELPASVQAILRHHITRLTAPERQLLEAASIVGLTFSAAALADRDEDIEQLEQRCEDLARRGAFINRSAPVRWPDGTVATSYAFRHALNQQALYEGAPAATRRGQHKRIGVRLEAAYGEHAIEIASVLADHFERAHDHARAALYRRLSGEAALRRGATRDAISQLRLALELNGSSPDGPERTRAELLTLMSLGSALIASEGFAASELPALYERVSALSGQLSDASTLAPALCGLWNYHLTQADLGTASGLVGRLTALTTDQANEGATMASQNAAGITRWFTGSPAFALANVEYVAAHYDIRLHADLSVTFGEDPGVVCHQYGAVVRQLLGLSDDAEQHFQDGMQIARALNQPFGVAQMLWGGAVIAREQGDLAKTKERATELIRVCEQGDTMFWWPGGHILAGWAAVAGDDSSGLEQIRYGMDAWERSQVSLTQPFSLAIYAEACGTCGYLADGRAALDEAFRIIEVTGERWYEAELYRLSAELALIEDGAQVERATRDLRRAVQVAKGQQAKHLDRRAAARLEQISQM